MLGIGVLFVVYDDIYTKKRTLIRRQRLNHWGGAQLEETLIKDALKKFFEHRSFTKKNVEFHQDVSIKGLLIW